MKWNFQADRPIYTQLIEQVELRIIIGFYPPGSRLPSVRDMASDAAVNPNTMQRALVNLEENGLLSTNRTTGRFVTNDEEKIMQIKNRLAHQTMQEFLQRMAGLGYDCSQSIELLQQQNKEEAVTDGAHSAVH